MKIVVDAMGGDNAPEEIIKGTMQAVEELNVEVIIVGKESLIKDNIDKYGKNHSNKIEIINAAEIITNDYKPLKAIS